MSDAGKEVYRCDVCNLEQDADDTFEEECPQCGTLDQFYLVDDSED